MKSMPFLGGVRSEERARRGVTPGPQRAGEDDIPKNVKLGKDLWASLCEVGSQRSEKKKLKMRTN